MAVGTADMDTADTDTADTETMADMVTRTWQNMLTTDQVFSMVGVSLGYGKRLEWPDDYFQFMAELGYQRYGLKELVV